MADMQAVVVIHGMGEQIPMDTIKGFIDAAWQKCDVITANGLPDPTEVWSKPDARTGSLELRRITTRESIVSLPHGSEMAALGAQVIANWNAAKASIAGIIPVK